MLSKKICSLLLSFVISLAGCMRENRKTETSLTTARVRNASPDIHTIIIKNDTTKDAALGGFGYRIYILNGVDTTFKIFQPAIPAIQGQKGFKTFSDAEKVSSLAAQKISEGNSFPNITTEELDSLRVDLN